MWSAGVVLLYMVVALGVVFGWWAGLGGARGRQMGAAVGAALVRHQHHRPGYLCPRDLFSTRTSFEVGLVVAVLATAIGAILGAIAGFFSGSWLDELIISG